MKKAALYFLIAALPVIAQTETKPEGWGWAKLTASVLGAGLISLKALTSDPNQT